MVVEAETGKSSIPSWTFCRDQHIAYPNSLVSTFVFIYYCIHEIPKSPLLVCSANMAVWNNRSPPRPIGGHTSLMDIAENTRPRRSNGAIFRRQSTNVTEPSSQAEPAVQTPSAETQDVQPPVNPSYEPSTDLRYTKAEILDIHKAQLNSDAPRRDVSNLFVGNWDPGHSNGTNGRGWGKGHDGRDNHGPNICWDTNGSVQPIGLEEMSEVERSVSALFKHCSSLTQLTTIRLSLAMSTLRSSHHHKT